MKRVQCSGFFFLVFLSAAALFTGCESKDDKIKEYASLTSGIGSTNEIKAEREYQDWRSKLMEADLERRQSFYQAVSGTFEGAFVMNGCRFEQCDFNIRVTLTPSLPRYVPSDRARLPEEVAADLNGLFLNAQMVAWNPRDTRGSVGCQVTNIRPDLERGVINIVSEGCPIHYSLQLADGSVAAGGPPNYARAAALASSMAQGRMPSASSLHGRMKLTSNASIYDFSVTRVQE